MALVHASPRPREDEIEIAHPGNAYEPIIVKVSENTGKRLQTRFGIHCNIELGKDLMDAPFEASDFSFLQGF